MRLRRDSESEKRSLGLFLAQNPGVDVSKNPLDRARAEEFINVNTYGTSRPAFSEDFGIPQLQEAVGQRRPADFLARISGQLEKQRPTSEARADIENRLQNVQDPRARERIRNIIMGRRGQATQAVLSRAENLFGQETEGLKEQLRSQQALFGDAMTQAAATEKERLAREAEERQFQREMMLRNLLSGGGEESRSSRSSAAEGEDGLDPFDLNNNGIPDVDEDLGEEVIVEDAPQGPSGPGVLGRAFSGMTGKELLGRLALGPLTGQASLFEPIAREVVPGAQEGLSRFLREPIGGPTQRLRQEDQELLDLAESNL